MANIIKPDIKFVRQIISAGAPLLKKCYQCATCSVICKLTPDDTPFPRKEMINAQWGLKDKLIGNPDIWLCHQCGDCSAYCPRGARPSEVIGALRNLMIQYYAFPKFLAKMANSPKGLPVLIALPVLVLLAVLAATGNLSIPEGEIIFSKFISHKYIDAIFIPVTMFVILVFISGIIRFWNDMHTRGNGTKQMNIIPAFISVILDILSHNRFRKCEVNRGRYIAHICIFYGFIGLAITTALAVVYLYILNIHSPYPQIHPIKIIGNISGILLLVGITLVVINRFRVKTQQNTGLGSYFDWLFITIIYVVVLSGFLSEITRLADIPILAYPVYFIHLSSVFFLFLYAPYSKLAHIAYRTIALVYAKQIKREI
jgi:quinone-modifying oxidoreductase subunit QmoC